jgi:hypothetical protein
VRAARVHFGVGNDREMNMRVDVVGLWALQEVQYDGTLVQSNDDSAGADPVGRVRTEGVSQSQPVRGER